MIAVVHKVRLAPAQKDTLVRLLRSSHAERPTAIVARLIWCEAETVHLIALWESRNALDRYLATAELPAVTEMLATLGTQARIVEVADYGLAARLSRTPDGRAELERGSAVGVPEPDAARPAGGP